MNTTVLKEIIAFILGRKYYANIIATKGTTRQEICSYIFATRQAAECHGCCVKCKAEGRNGTCYGQTCFQSTRLQDGQRFEIWLHIATTLRPELQEYIPHKFLKPIKHHHP